MKTVLVIIGALLLLVWASKAGLTDALVHLFNQLNTAASNG